MRSAHFLSALALAVLPLPALAATTSVFDTLSGEAPKVIAHRGASGYEPEHTMASYELAAKLGADYVEPDVVITKDGVAICLHDTTLTRTTNVEQVFPGRASYAASEFTYAEIQQLTVDYKPARDVSQSELPDFVPSSLDPFKVPTLQQVVDFVVDYNAANGTDIGIYPELKTADNRLNRIIVETLKDAGFDGPDDKVYIQSFDMQTLKDVKEIQAELGTDIPQIALGSARVTGGVAMLGSYALDDLAAFIDGLGPSKGGVSEQFVALAHLLGLEVHPYTFSQGDDALAYAELEKYFDWGIDGFFSNFSDVAQAAIDKYLELHAPAPVPLPAAGLLLIAGLGAMGAVRARRRA